MVLFKEGIPYEGLHANQMAKGAVALSEVTSEQLCPDSSSQMRQLFTICSMVLQMQIVRAIGQ